MSFFCCFSYLGLMIRSMDCPITPSTRELKLLTVVSLFNLILCMTVLFPQSCSVWVMV